MLYQYLPNITHISNTVIFSEMDDCLNKKFFNLFPNERKDTQQDDLYIRKLETIAMKDLTSMKKMDAVFMNNHLPHIISYDIKKESNSVLNSLDMVSKLFYITQIILKHFVVQNKTYEKEVKKLHVDIRQYADKYQMVSNVSLVWNKICNTKRDTNY